MGHLRIWCWGLLLLAMGNWAHADSLSRDEQIQKRKSLLKAAAEELLSPRFWKDPKGQAVRGTFVRIHQGQVVLKRTGRIGRIPYASFSPSDQELIRRGLEHSGQDGILPQATSLVVNAEVRSWRDASDQQQQARLVRVVGRRVLLASPVPTAVPATDLAILVVQYDKLSREDQEYIYETIDAQGEAARLEFFGNARPTDTPSGPPDPPVVVNAAPPIPPRAPPSMPIATAPATPTKPRHKPTHSARHKTENRPRPISTSPARPTEQVSSRPVAPSPVPHQPAADSERNNNGDKDMDRFNSRWESYWIAYVLLVTFLIFLVILVSRGWYSR